MNKMLLSTLAMVTALWAATLPRAQADQAPTALSRVEARGALEVAVYRDFAPYSFLDSNGRPTGIDVDIARALAKKLGVVAAIHAVGADETMEDDLRNNVWKGHYLGGHVADVMLHSPYDRAYAEDNRKVDFVAPYYREQVVVAIPAAQAKGGPVLDRFTHEKVGVEGDTLADFFLLQAYDGQIRNQVVHFSSTLDAVAALKRGEVAGVMGPRTEIEYALGKDMSKYAVGPVKMPGMRSSGWDLGAAVKRGNTALAQAIDKAMAELRTSGAVQHIFQRYGASYQQPSIVVRLPDPPPKNVALESK
jgi:ABC-type amino acid transport substrate-binding protein